MGTEINLGYNFSTCIKSLVCIYAGKLNCSFLGKQLLLLLHWDACTPVGFIDKRQRRPIFVQTDMLRMLNLMNKVRDKENYCRKVFSDTICVSADSIP